MSPEAKLRHDPACLLKNKDHDGPHVVAPDHPALQNPLVYRCRKDGWAFHDPSWQDLEDHWETHNSAEFADGRAAIQTLERKRG